MSEDKQCPQCGTAAAENASLEGLCPRCLYVLALGGEPGERRMIGHYEILGELGRGGMGIVYKAFEPSLNRMVALKVLAEHLSMDAAFIKRFRREGQAVAHLSHTSVVTIYQIGQDGDTHFIAMEYFKGQTVSELIKEKGQLDSGPSLEIVRQVLGALAEAHGAGIVHRDIKPQNIMVDDLGRAKVMDFGIAKWADAGTALTQTGSVLGTPHYMSPEQCRGTEIDARSDVYSLGVVLYEMLAGRAPFVSETPLAVIHQILNETPPALRNFNSTVPREVTTIIERAMMAQPEERYGSALEMEEDVGLALAGFAPVAARKWGAAARKRRGEKKKSFALSLPTWKTSAIGLGGIVVVVGLTMVLNLIWSPTVSDRSAVDLAAVAVPPAPTPAAESTIQEPAATIMASPKPAVASGRAFEDANLEATVRNTVGIRSGPLSRENKAHEDHTISQIQLLRQGTNGISSLEGAASIVLSDDGKYGYAGSVESLKLSVFSRNPSTGHLSLLQTLPAEAHAIAISPDNRHLYAAGPGGVAGSLLTLARSQEYGTLTIIQSLIGGVDGARTLKGAGSLALSPDGNNLYVALHQGNSLVSFARNRSTGVLSRIQTIDGADGNAGLRLAEHVIVSRDGRRVYVTNGSNDGRNLSIFVRENRTGLLSHHRTLEDGIDGIVGLRGARGMAFSLDGEYLYVAHSRNSVSVFAYDPDSPDLTFVQSHPIKGEGQALAISPQGPYLYVVGLIGSRLSVLLRDETTGLLQDLTGVEDGIGGIDGLQGSNSIVVSPEGRHIYVASGAWDFGEDDTIAVFDHRQSPLRR